MEKRVERGSKDASLLTRIGRQQLFVGGRVNIIGVGFPWLLFNLYDQKISSKLIVCLLFMVIIVYLRNSTVGFTAAFTVKKMAVKI